MTTTQETPDPRAAGATLHLGGDAYCTPDLQPLLVPADRVQLYPGNARRHDQDAITASLADLGCHRAVNAQTSTGYALVGNGMLRGLLDLGATQVPVTWRDCTDTVARQIVVRDNRTGDLATDDPVDLYALLDALASDGTDLTRIGYDTADLALLARAVEAADVFTAGADHMLDEFREISGQTGDPSYKPEYARKVTVFIRDQEAIDDFRKRLRIKDPLGADLNYPLDWTPDDRRKRRPPEAEHDG